MISFLEIQPLAKDKQKISRRKQSMAGHTCAVVATSQLLQRIGDPTTKSQLTIKKRASGQPYLNHGHVSIHLSISHVSIAAAGFATHEN